MIRLIASDIDGTLLPYDETVMPQRLFPLIRRLRDLDNLPFGIRASDYAAPLQAEE